MREIKFRAWDVERGEWLNETDTYSQVEYQARGNPVAGAYYVVEQFTGLKDKNGKEIYEGDIVRAGAWIQPEADENGWMNDTIHVVEWGGETTSYPGFDLKPTVEYIEWNNLQHFAAIHPEGDEAIEVIGNIHENPELIKPQRGEK